MSRGQGRGKQQACYGMTTTPEGGIDVLSMPNNCYTDMKSSALFSISLFVCIFFTAIDFLIERHGVGRKFVFVLLILPLL